MRKQLNFIATVGTVRALEAIANYRYLTVKQVATICGVKAKNMSEMLLRVERSGLLAHFGNVGLRGYGRVPKCYFITKRGYNFLTEELGTAGRLLGPYTEPNIKSRWSPIMYHRIATLDVLSFVERDCRWLQSYQLLGTLVEYRRQRVAGRWRKETTDYVANTNAPSDKIVPDAGFALLNRKTGKRALFLIEADCGTMRLDTSIADEDVSTFTSKLAKYDQYLASGRIKDRHPQLGQFSGFHLLTVTTSPQRIANMRAAAQSLSPKFHPYFRFSTFDEVRQSLLHRNWLSRDHADHQTYPLIKGT